MTNISTARPPARGHRRSTACRRRCRPCRHSSDAGSPGTQPAAARVTGRTRDEPCGWSAAAACGPTRSRPRIMASLANSAGWSTARSRLSQFRLPFTLIPTGCRSGSAARRQGHSAEPPKVGVGSFMITTAPTTPMPRTAAASRSGRSQPVRHVRVHAGRRTAVITPTTSRGHRAEHQVVAGGSESTARSHGGRGRPVREGAARGVRLQGPGARSRHDRPPSPLLRQFAYGRGEYSARGVVGVHVLVLPGPAAPASPGPREAAAGNGLRHGTVVSVAAIGFVTGTVGACWANASAITSRSTPSSTARAGRSQPVEGRALGLPAGDARPPSRTRAVHRRRRRFVGVVDPAHAAALGRWSGSCGPNYTVAETVANRAGRRTYDRASAAAARALAKVVGPPGDVAEHLASSSAESRRASMKARSTSTSSTTPKIERAGDKGEPDGPGPLDDLACSTSRSVAGSSTLVTGRWPGPRE